MEFLCGALPLLLQKQLCLKKKKLFFRAVLNSQEKWSENPEFPYLPCTHVHLPHHPCHQHPRPQWYICDNHWARIDKSYLLSLKVCGLYWGSLLVLDILSIWIIYNAMLSTTTGSQRTVSLPWKSSVLCLFIPPSVTPC